MPKISVIMPAYNSELYLKEAIDSILNQSLTDFELIIYNDGSIDSTDSIIKSYRDSRLIYKNNKENIGYLDLLNEGLSIAEGKYIARMDADDIALPNRLKEQFNYMEANPDIGVCGSWIEFIGAKSGVEKRPVTFEEIQYHLFYGCPLTHPAVMMRNDFLKKYNLRYDKKYYYAEDHDFFLRGSFHFKLVNLPLVLLKYRIHPTQIGSAKWMEQLLIKHKIQAKIFAEVLKPCSSSEINWLENFFTEQSTPSKIWFTKVEIFRKKVIAENQKKLIYPQELLCKAANDLFFSKIKSNLHNYYFKKYYNQKSFNLSLLFAFLTEKDKPFLLLGGKLTLFFIAKCLLSYNRKKAVLF